MKNVSFLITVYKNDKVEYFKEAVSSIVEQEYAFSHIHIYLGIDGPVSEDISNYISRHRGLFYKIMENKTNRGLAYTLNRLIESLEDEEYIFRMDSDDICRKDRIRKTLEKFESDRNLLFVGSDMIEIDREGKKLFYKKMPESTEEILRYSVTRNPFNHPTVAFRKSFFATVGLYRESLLKSQDYELWARALKKGAGCTNISEALVFFRRTESFMVKRNSWRNSLSELKVSLDLMVSFNQYGQLPKIVAKFVLRLLPAWFGEKAYARLRAKPPQHIPEDPAIPSQKE